MQVCLKKCSEVVAGQTLTVRFLPPRPCKLPVCRMATARTVNLAATESARQNLGLARADMHKNVYFSDTFSRKTCPKLQLACGSRRKFWSARARSCRVLPCSADWPTRCAFHAWYLLEELCCATCLRTIIYHSFSVYHKIFGMDLL